MAVTEKQIADALEKTGGFISHAAKMLKVTHGAVSKRVSKSEHLQTVLADIKESRLDLAETKLMEKVNSADLGAICFYLKCQGKGRGYVEKQQLEHTGKDGEPIKNSIQIEFVKPDKE